MKSLDTTGDNYQIAFDLIKDRFSHHRRIVYSHVNVLLNINFENAKSFINTVDQHVRSLEALKVPVKDYDALLIPTLTSKLDTKTIHGWQTKIVSLPRELLPTYSEFRTYMLFLAETPEEIKITTKNTFHKGKFHTNNYSSISNIACPHCKEDRFIQKCETFLNSNPRERFNLIKNLKLCINFFRKGHFIKACKPSKCKICRNLHNTPLHNNQRSTNDIGDISSKQMNSQETIQS